MALKGWIEACNHKGGIIRYLYDVLVTMDAGDSDLADKVDDIETAIGDSESGLVKDVADIKAAIGSESDATSILGRLKALEVAEVTEGHE